jgi:hypothetical protein
MDFLTLLNSRPRRAVAAVPPEDIRPNSTTSSYETFIGATEHAALADNSDASYVNGDATFVQWVGGLADLTLAAGREIASFSVIVRAECQIPESQTSAVTPTVTGATVAGDGTFTAPAPVGNATAGPFTKSGGGNFTETQINSLALNVSIDSAAGSPRIYEVTVRVTYAALVLTETIAINSIGSKTGTVTGAADTTAGAITVLNDGSDATYVGVGSGNGTSVSTVGWADLVGTGNVASFVINLRGNGSLGASTFANITPTPTSQSVQQVSSASTVGPFTRNGGGTWTPAEFNAMTCTLASAQGVSGAWRLYRAELVVTYA